MYFWVGFLEHTGRYDEPSDLPNLPKIFGQTTNVRCDLRRRNSYPMGIIRDLSLEVHLREVFLASFSLKIAIILHDHGMRLGDTKSRSGNEIGTFDCCQMY